MPDPNEPQTESTFRIRPEWKDLMVYDEGQDRLIKFDCGSVGQAFYVSVPNEKAWKWQTPAWAHDRRMLILGRLRAADCVICEVGDFVHSTFSPDGLFRVEEYNEPEPPFPPRLEIRVVRNDGDVPVVRFPGAGIGGIIAFPSPGVVTIPFTFPGERHQIGIDVNAATFWLHPNEQPRPLDQLPPLLAARSPQRVPNWASEPKSKLRAVGGLLLCVMFVACGIWQAVAGKSLADHIIGSLCILFFSLCAIAPILDLRRK